MAIAFRPLDFLQPIALLRMRALMARGQWWPEETLSEYQRRRLTQVLQHAATSVPYYQAAWAAAGVPVGDIGTVEGLRALPLLTKNSLRTRRAELVSRQAARFRPSEISSTGSTGPAVHVLLDRTTKALEFAYYWRHWGWFGYRLGDPFAHLSWAEFSGARATLSSYVQRGTGRLLLNALSLSASRVAECAAAMRAHRARFLKGHPSALLHFALFVRAGRVSLPPLRAVFTTGETLEPSARTIIEDILQTRVADSYGTMERVVAACECPEGRMHMASDYGIWELIDAGQDPISGRPIARIVGTGLHNFSMPLVRYELGDIAERDDGTPCRCGRTFPTVGRILGRTVDAIVTPDDRIVTVSAIVFNAVPAVLRGQIVQEERSRLRVLVLAVPDFCAEDERRLREAVTHLVGTSMRIDIERVSGPEAFGPDGVKHRTVVSAIARDLVERRVALP